MTAPASARQVVSAVTLWDYEIAPDGTPLSKASIEVMLNYSLATLASPAVALESVKQTTTTDSNGQWHVDLVANSVISPANTIYVVRTPYRSFAVSIPAGAGPFQASTILVNTPLALLPSGPYTAGGLFFGGSIGAVTQDASNLFWDDINNRLGVGTNAPAAPLHVVGHISGSGASTPTLGALQAGISAQSFAAGSTDTRGVLSVTTTGAPPAAGATIAIITFAAAYPSPGAYGFFTNTSGNQTISGFASGGGATFTVFTQAALAGTTTYNIYYWMLG